jgi:phosphoribosylformylglycinamidine synthase
LGNDPKLWAKPFSALLGAYEALTNFKLSAIGGKDSMSGTYEDIFVPPTLISFAVSTTTNDVISPEFKFSNSTIALVLPKKIKDGTIDINVLKKNYDVVHQGIIKKQIVSAYSLKHFGIAEGLSKMSIGNDIGVDFYNLSSKELFAINYGALIVEIFHNCDPLKVLKNSHFKIIGHTTKNPTIINQRLKINIPLNQIKHALVNKLANVYTNSTKTNNQNVKLKPYHLNQRRFSKKIIKTPLVVIPVFPGTNCEYDSQLAFERVGAKVQQVLIRNLTSKDLLNSINKLAKVIDRANIVMIPGGFSAADEPDGSAKFIVNVFRHSSIKKAINKLLNKRDGLMIGICNGFQALIKLGLLPNGKIQKMTKSSPTLTFNKISHHMSTIVRTKVVSNMSPWLAQLKPGDVHLIPISHGEGQFVANIHQIREMEKNGQITTQYVDLNHEPTMNMPYNPNGSTFAIEGISSADGRIFGKMGHSERIGKNLYRNLIGEYDQKIFASGVNYFTHKH